MGHFGQGKILLHKVTPGPGRNSIVLCVIPRSLKRFDFCSYKCSVQSRVADTKSLVCSSLDLQSSGHCQVCVGQGRMFLSSWSPSSLWKEFSCSFFHSSYLCSLYVLLGDKWGENWRTWLLGTQFYFTEQFLLLRVRSGFDFLRWVINKMSFTSPSGTKQPGQVGITMMNT